MKSITITALLTSSMMGTTMFMTGCQGTMADKTLSQSAQSTPAVKTVTQAVTLNLKAGQVIQMATPKAKPGDAGLAARRTYGSKVLPFAQQFGNARLGQLNITETVVGKEKLEALAFYSFPDEASRAEFDTHPDWPGYKALRPDGWDDLMIYSSTMTEDLVLNFDPNKFYTLAVAWTNPENPTDYATYLDGVETDFERVGARFMYEFKNLDYQTNNDPDAKAPTQLTFVEWETSEGLMSLLGGDAYKANADYFQRGVADIKLYRLAVSPAP